MPIVGQFGSLAGLGSLVLPGGAMESIATVTVGSGGASSITFSDLPSGFQHLQIRLIGRCTSTGNFVNIEVNSDTGSNYAVHRLSGDGASAAAAAGTSTASTSQAYLSSSSSTASVFGAAVIDLLDYASTTKNKTFRSLTGFDNNGSGQIHIRSGLWMSTNAVTSLKLTMESNNFAQHTTAALYAIR